MSPPRARPAALLAAALSAAALGACNGCPAAPDGGPSPDAAPFTVAIGTTTDNTAGFRLLADGDTVEVILGQQGGTMCYLRYGVPADVTTAVTASVNVALDGYEPFDRGPFIGAADAEPGAPGLVTTFHRVLFGNLSLGALEGLAGTFTLTLSDGLGRTGIAAVRVVLHDDVECQDLGPGLCIPYGEAGVDGGGAGVDGGASATDAGP